MGRGGKRERIKRRHARGGAGEREIDGWTVRQADRLLRHTQGACGRTHHLSLTWHDRSNVV